MMRYALALCLTVLATPLAAETTRLGASPTLGGGSYSTGGGISVAVEPRRTANGQLAICGVWAESDRLSAPLRGRALGILATGSIAVNGVAVLSNLRFLRQSPAAESYANAEATCALTNRRFTGAERLEVWLPRQEVAMGRGDSKVRFGPARRDNPAMGAGSLFPRSWTVFQSPGGRFHRDGQDP